MAKHFKPKPTRRPMRSGSEGSSWLLRIIFTVLVVVVIGGVVYLAAGAFGAGSAGQQEPQAQDDGAARSAEAADAPSVEELLAQRVADKVGSLTLEQKVAQMFIVRPESLTGVGQVVSAGDTTRQALAQTTVGGIVYFADNLQDADQTRTMLANTQAYAQEANGLPIFLCVDEEGGTVSRVGGNSGFDIANVGNMSDIGATGDTDRAYQVAQQIGTYLTDLGFNVDFAPDADIANNPESDTMSLRSFGASAGAVAPMVAAQVRGFTDAGILSAAKHFPGIGGAEGDSHSTKIYSTKTADEMASEELLPFQAAIGEDVPFVMVGHLSCPSITGDDDPATISSEIVTDLLRNQLGCQGIIITDSMGMGAATETLTADRLAVEAIKAGVDVVLMPEDFNAAYQGVLDAVSCGELTEERINESVERIVRVKLERLETTSSE